MEGGGGEEDDVELGVGEEGVEVWIGDMEEEGGEEVGRGVVGEEIVGGVSGEDEGGVGWGGEELVEGDVGGKSVEMGGEGWGEGW